MLKITFKWAGKFFRKKPKAPPRPPVRGLSMETRRRLLAAHIIQATAKADGSIFWGER